MEKFGPEIDPMDSGEREKIKETTEQKIKEQAYTEQEITEAEKQLLSEAGELFASIDPENLSADPIENAKLLAATDPNNEKTQSLMKRIQNSKSFHVLLGAVATISMFAGAVRVGKEAFEAPIKEREKIVKKLESEGIQTDFENLPFFSPEKINKFLKTHPEVKNISIGLFKAGASEPLYSKASTTINYGAEILVTITTKDGKIYELVGSFEDIHYTGTIPVISETIKKMGGGEEWSQRQVLENAAKRKALTNAFEQYDSQVQLEK